MGVLAGYVQKKNHFSLRSQNKFSIFRRTHRTRGQQSRRDSIRNGLQQNFTLKKKRKLNNFYRPCSVQQCRSHIRKQILFGFRLHDV